MCQVYGQKSQYHRILVIPKLMYYWIQFSKNLNRFLTELDKANSKHMGKQYSKVAQTLMKKNQLVVVLP